MGGHKQQNSGFTLLEVLISVVIMSIGVLGVATLQLTSSAYGNSGIHRSQASALGREIGERMRANPGLAKAGSYDFNTMPTLTQDCHSPSANCSVTQMRDHDLRLWTTAVAAILPAGTATIATNNGVTPTEITVTLSWAGRRGRLALPGEETVTVSQAFVFSF